MLRHAKYLFFKKFKIYLLNVYELCYDKGDLRGLGYITGRGGLREYY